MLMQLLLLRMLLLLLLLLCREHAESNMASNIGKRARDHSRQIQATRKSRQ